VYQLLEEWRNNMKNIIYSSWILCLDESMSILMNRYTCPGWVFCPFQPHLFDNEYHTICCGETGILFDFEIVEDTDCPHDMPHAEYTDKGKTAGLLLCLTKQVHHSACYVVLDSRFCVLSALVELQKVGVFAGALIEKHWFWPAFVPGDVIDSYFTNLDVRSMYAVAEPVGWCQISYLGNDGCRICYKNMGTASGLIYHERG
jgi:hypothetical protein